MGKYHSMKLSNLIINKSMKSFYIAALLLFSLGLKAQINTPSGASHPFNSNTGYSFGILPTNLPSGGTLGKSQDAANAYNTWKSNYVRACGSQYRVLFDDGSSTVSEGIGYGMLLAAYAADKPLFDGLWAYYKANADGNGLMNWKIGGCTGATGTYGATDADEDAAMALIVAACQWPSGTTYSSDATNLISAINRCEIDIKSTNPGQISNGDGWISCGASSNTCRNPSYMAPAYFKAFAAFVPSIASALNNVVTSCYTIVNNNANSSTGLVSNWSDQNGTPNTCNGPLLYGYESCRNPWRMAVDALWNNDARAATICSKVAGYVQGIGAGAIAGPVAMSGGTGQYHNATFVSTFACGISGAGSGYQSLLNNMYLETVKVTDSPPAYFGNTLRCLSLFVLSGNFWKPCGTTSTTCTTPPATITANGPTNFCAGGNVVLNANTGTGYTYQWMNNGGAISGATSASYTATTTGNYTVKVFSGSCTATSSSVSVNVSASPAASITASGSTTFCSGGSVVLNASTGNGYSYQWKNNGTAIAGATSASFTATTSGNYTVVVTASSCSATSAGVVVTVNTGPTATITSSGPSFCSKGSVVLKANTGNGYTYQWQYNNNAISGAVNYNYTARAAGNYTVSITSNGCTSTSSVHSIASCRLAGLNANSAAEFNVYPSPITSGLEIELKGWASLHIDINILNMLGEKVWSGEENAIGDEFRKYIDISNLPSGIYFLTMKSEKSILLKKILKQ
jgi:endo-1,4-beta-D-glucanase Y